MITVVTNGENTVNAWIYMFYISYNIADNDR